MHKDFYTIKEFCEVIGIGRSTFYTLLKKDPKPPVIKLGRRSLIERQSGLDWVKNYQNYSENKG